MCKLNKREIHFEVSSITVLSIIWYMYTVKQMKAAQKINYILVMKLSRVLKAKYMVNE